MTSYPSASAPKCAADILPTPAGPEKMAHLFTRLDPMKHKKSLRFIFFFMSSSWMKQDGSASASHPLFHFPWEMQVQQERRRSCFSQRYIKPNLGPSGINWSAGKYVFRVSVSRSPTPTAQRPTTQTDPSPVEDVRVVSSFYIAPRVPLFWLISCLDCLQEIVNFSSLFRWLAASHDCLLCIQGQRPGSRLYNLDAVEIQRNILASSNIILSLLRPNLLRNKYSTINVSPYFFYTGYSSALVEGVVIYFLHNSWSGIIPWSCFLTRLY
jgi:hypothetical protein